MPMKAYLKEVKWLASEVMLQLNVETTIWVAHKTRYAPSNLYTERPVNLRPMPAFLLEKERQRGIKLQYCNEVKEIKSYILPELGNQ